MIQKFPWETIPILSTTPVSRVPSMHMLHSLAQKYGFYKQSSTLSLLSPSTDLKLRDNFIRVNPKLAYYILNPGKDLPGVQERLQPIVELIWGKSGISGSEPIEQDIKQSLTSRDVFLLVRNQFIEILFQYV